MNVEDVTSREYKVMVQSQRFAGDQRQLLRTASIFWSEFKQAVDNIVGDKDGRLETIGTRRRIRFYDTRARLLETHGYIFRERRDIDTGKREVTLKFRHPDRYISQDRRMESCDADKGRTKFEEDIKPPFFTLYSFSTTQQIANSKKLNEIKDVARLYPGLADSLIPYEADAEIDIVKGFTARELTIAGGSFRISKEPMQNSECAFIVWYEDQGDERRPVVVEFSFRYGSKDGKYKRGAAHRAYEVFLAMQASLTGWIDPNSKTKTAFVQS